MPYVDASAPSETPGVSERGPIDVVQIDCLPRGDVPERPLLTRPFGESHECAVSPQLAATRTYVRKGCGVLVIVSPIARLVHAHTCGSSL